MNFGNFKWINFHYGMKMDNLLENVLKNLKLFINLIDKNYLLNFIILLKKFKEK